MRDIYQFLRNFVANPTTIGAILPSSNKLALRICQESLTTTAHSSRYLEVGGGSGALTKHILNHLKEKDHLDIVELNPKFCAILRKKFAHLPNISIHETSILDFQSSPYDSVISSLPLNSFKSDSVVQIFYKLKKLTKHGGMLSYFEYMGLEEIKKIYLSGRYLEDFKKTLAAKRNFADQFCKITNKIWWNVPPARIFHCIVD